jgi:hypothetical protein
MIATRQGGRAPCIIVSHKSVFLGSRRGFAAPLGGTPFALEPVRIDRQM